MSAAAAARNGYSVRFQYPLSVVLAAIKVAGRSIVWRKHSPESIATNHNLFYLEDAQ